MTKQPHHEATIQRTIEHFQAQPEVLALLLGGSIAHGWAQPTSDVDILIIVSDEEHEQRSAKNDTQFFSLELATYEGGYVDGKYISPKFLAQVEARGSEPARFAFADAQVLFSHLDGLAERLTRIARYPVEDKLERIKRFHAQFQAWYWFTGDAEQKQNRYLLNLAVNKLQLFGGRMVLAHNEMLYPFHKWFLGMLERAPHKPEKLLEVMRTLSESPSHANATTFFNLINDFRTWETDDIPWPTRFLRDNELTWLEGTTPIDDV